MTDQRSTTPPDELVRQWLKEKPVDEYAHRYLATQAAQWGADQELEACCEWLTKYRKSFLGADLRFVRRPKLLSLKEQALELVRRIEEAESVWALSELNIVRRALEALPND